MQKINFTVGDRVKLNAVGIKAGYDFSWIKDCQKYGAKVLNIDGNFIGLRIENINSIWFNKFNSNRASNYCLFSEDLKCRKK
jgi:hypothetical protein